LPFVFTTPPKCKPFTMLLNVLRLIVPPFRLTVVAGGKAVAEPSVTLPPLTVVPPL
jgi:hypothetical protein